MSARADTCPVHPGHDAFVTCRRCGTPGCAYCFAGGDDVCEACRTQEDAGGAIAWERRDLAWPSRFFRTLRQVLGDTRRTFGVLPRGGIGLPLAFTALVWALPSILSSAVLAPLLAFNAAGRHHAVGLVALEESFALFGLVGCLCVPIPQAIFGVLLSLALGVCFHLGARIVGGRGELEDGLRATAYASAIALLWAPALATSTLPVLGAIVGLGVLAAQLVWGAVALTQTAHTRYGLRGGAAVFAGALPSLAVGTFLLLAWLVTVLLHDASTPSQAPDVYLGAPT